jgi:hypothetical protein
MKGSKKIVGFAVIGVTQTLYLLYHGHILFYLFFPFLSAISGALWLKNDVENYFAVQTAVLLISYMLPNVAEIKYSNSHTDGSSAAFAVRYEDCSRPHLLLQSASPVSWFLADNTMHLRNATQYSQFRVIAFCENLKHPVVGPTVFIDAFTLRNWNDWKATAVGPEHQREVVPLVESKLQNAFYKNEARDRVIIILWAIWAGRTGWDLVLGNLYNNV